MTARPPAYERDPSLATLRTHVVAVANDGRPYALLEDSIFYPEGGGQPADRGTLGDLTVLDAQRVEGETRVYLSGTPPVGPVELELDWQRRFDHMQQHTAQHLLTAVAVDHFGWATTSFHLGLEQSDIELDTESIDAGELRELEELVAREIHARRPVSTRRISMAEYQEIQSTEVRSRGLPTDHSGDVRLVEIEGLDITTCGGTHLPSTAEIETLTLGPTEKIRGGIRLFWRAGSRVRRRLRILEDRNRDLRTLFETSGEELHDVATAKLELLKSTTRALRGATDELAEVRARALAASPDSVLDAHFEDVDGGSLQRLAREVLAAAPHKAAIFTATGSKGHFFLIAAGEGSDLEVAALGPEVAQILDGRGGGSGTTFQGKAGSLERRQQAVEVLLRVAEE